MLTPGTFQALPVVDVIARVSVRMDVIRCAVAGATTCSSTTVLDPVDASSSGVATSIASSAEQKSGLVFAIKFRFCYDFVSYL